MSRFPAMAGAVSLVAAACAVSPGAMAQDVAIAPLAAPDAFSTAGRDTGLPSTLWQGASAETLRRVLPLLASKPLSPAAAALARRVLATGAPAPQGAGEDPALAAARSEALSAQGDPKAAGTILSRAPGVERSPELARAAAESALLAGDDARACALEKGLSSGRDDIYWLRLRAYCQAVAGEAAQAQLTFDLAQGQARDAVYGRLMGAKLAGVGSPGAASLRNGLDFALSRSLGLDVSAAKPTPAVGAALSAADPDEPSWTLPSGADPVSVAVRALAEGQAVDPETVQAGLDLARDADAKVRSRAEGAALLIAVAAGLESSEIRSRIAGLVIPEGKAPIGRNLALAASAEQKLMGETALLALWTASEAGAAGVSVADRVRIVRALRQVGLDRDARAFAVEGLLALK